MKYLITFFLLLSTISVFSQLKSQEYKELDLKIVNLQSQLEYYRYQHNFGVGLQYGGLSMALTGVWLQYRADNNFRVHPLTAMGCIMTTAGVIVDLNSYKFLKFGTTFYEIK
jgi:succinate-acetate transporter protein